MLIRFNASLTLTLSPRRGNSLLRLLVARQPPAQLRLRTFRVVVNVSTLSSGERAGVRASVRTNQSSKSMSVTAPNDADVTVWAYFARTPRG